MNSTKLIIMSWISYDRRRNDLFAVPELLDKGINVEYWDVSDITFKQEAVSPVIPKGLVIRDIDSLNEFERLVKYNPNAYYVVMMNYGITTHKCYRILSKYNATILYCITGLQPQLVTSKDSKWDWSRIKIQFHNTLKKFPNAYVKLYQKLFIKPTDYILYTCNKALKIKNITTKTCDNTKLVPFNSNDYQIAMFMSKPLEEYENKNYFVFLDEYVPFHPDLAITGEKFDADDYFSLMNEYFDRIETKYGIKVIIAAHPAATKYREHNYFNGREVVFNKTCELVRSAQAVLTGCSTAIYFSVIFNKPLILIPLSQPYSHSLSLGYHRILNCYILNEYKDVESLPNSLVIDKHSYDKFRYDYMTTVESEKRPNGDILYDLVMKKK